MYWQMRDNNNNEENEMNTDELIIEANKNASERADKYNELRDTLGFKEANTEWNKISGDYSPIAMFNGVICESTCCYRGLTRYFQNRFYFIGEGDAYRKQFSKAKAVARLG